MWKIIPDGVSCEIVRLIMIALRSLRHNGSNEVSSLIFAASVVVWPSTTSARDLCFGVVYTDASKMKSCERLTMDRKLSAQEVSIISGNVALAYLQRWMDKMNETGALTTAIQYLDISIKNGNWGQFKTRSDAYYFRYLEDTGDKKSNLLRALSDINNYLSSSLTAMHNQSTLSNEETDEILYSGLHDEIASKAEILSKLCRFDEAYNAFQIAARYARVRYRQFGEDDDANSVDVYELAASRNTSNQAIESCRAALEK